ncbi:protein-domain-containing protein [Pilobolus umbonatus]|nr:protein-domain-containing protein [Pilobolus umbonatus]
MNSTSKLFEFDILEQPDEVDTELAVLYAQHCEAAKNKTDIELHNYLQDKASQNKKEYNGVVSGLLYGVLTEPEKSRMFFQSISYVNRDNFSVVTSRLQALIMSIKFHLMRVRVREQILWLIGELTQLNVQNIDTLYLCLLRQVRGGDTSAHNTLFCEQVLKLIESHRQWLELNPRVIATSVYTYLRIITDHRSAQLQALQQREIRFLISILREKWLICTPIGRDLIRVLRELTYIPEFNQLWDDLVHHPEKLSPRFQGIDTLLKQPTPKEFLRCRLTPEMEYKLLYILQNLKSSQYHRNLTWFIQRFMNTPESESFSVDIIRYLVAGWYPNNAILQSDIVPRYIVIGSMIRNIKNPVVAASVKTALIFDWLFFTSADNIMFIEPAMLLMERSAERYPYITGMIMEFLKHSVDEFYPPMKSYMAQCVSCGMQVILNKGVIRSLIPIYDCPSLDPMTQKYIKELFGEFLVKTPANPPHLPANPTYLPANQPTFTVQEGETEPAIEDSVSEEDDDMDEYLYGESDEAPKQIPPPPPPPAVVEETMEVEPEPEPVEIGEEEQEEDVNNIEGLQSNQSYWIFGDSLKRFKESCALLTHGLRESNRSEYDTQIQLSKRSLKEILAVYLRMAIPAETIAPNIGGSIRNTIAHTLLILQPNKPNESEEDILNDPTRDVFDLLMVTFWNHLNNEPSLSKMIRLISCIAHTSKVKGKKHMIGMRWWYFISSHLPKNENTELSWYRLIATQYDIYLTHAYSVDESVTDKEKFMVDYLLNDLQTLAEQSISAMNLLIPYIYRYLPKLTVGRFDLLKLTLSMILPDQLGNLIYLLHFGTIEIFGPNAHTTVIPALQLPYMDMTMYWQLLDAESKSSESKLTAFYYQTFPHVRPHVTEELIPPLMSILCGMVPDIQAITCLVEFYPFGSLNTAYKKILISLFQYWSVTQSSLFSKGLKEYAVKARSETENTESVINLFDALSDWWDHDESHGKVGERSGFFLFFLISFLVLA